MNYLSGESIAKNLGERILFEGLDISINQGDKMALVANNGTGKSSLLKILAKIDEPDTGTVRWGKNIRIAYLSQESTFDENQTIQELIDHSSTDVISIIRSYEDALEAQTNDFNEETQRAFEYATTMMDQYNAWDFERKLKELLHKFNVFQYDQPISVLSGGQKKRLAISLTLLSNPDLILLDEPTNHLDLEMIEWLEKYLTRSTISILMVSHDRYFIDAICNQIIELESGILSSYKGNYAYYLEKKALQEMTELSEINKAQQLLKKELEWMRRSPKARTTKSKSRISSFYHTEAKAKSGKHEKELDLSVKMSRIGGKVLELKKVYKSYDQLKIIQGFDYTFKKGERIGIVGKNGTGKSTLLNMIMGLELPDSGKINRGETIVFGYYSQDGVNSLKNNKRVIEILKDIADVITLANGSVVSASQLLNLFLFPPSMQNQFVEKLSGGEKRRLYLLTVLMKNPNFLILDEPTNDLDILTLNKLESFLEDFGGCILMVSHDRYFLDKIVDHLFIFEGEGVINNFNGSYTEYRQKKDEPFINLNQKPTEISSIKEKKKDPRTTLSFKEKYEYESLEKEIAHLEKEKDTLEKLLAKKSSDYTFVTENASKLNEIIGAINQKTDRWITLSERI
ncbi:ABC-F family ATP-binding cassette domain-containing protein [Bacteroidia bacterium]|nr:ABC-F family ATP-binding cassette domain-containing protein [Bacteroidia bacterium]